MSPVGCQELSCADIDDMTYDFTETITTTCDSVADNCTFTCDVSNPGFVYPVSVITCPDLPVKNTVWLFKHVKFVPKFVKYSDLILDTVQSREN